MYSNSSENYRNIYEINIYIYKKVSILGLITVKISQANNFCCFTLLMSLHAVATDWYIKSAELNELQKVRLGLPSVNGATDNLD